MPRWETLTALVAVVAAGLGAWPIRWHGAFTILALALLSVVAVARVRAFARTRAGRMSTDAGERAARIRAERKRRLDR